MNTKERMTVHEALSEQKVITSRIRREMSEFSPCFANKHSNATVDGLSIAEHEERIRSKFQKIRDLVNRRNAMKRAILASNACTTVRIGEVMYTVAEAIDMKQNVIGMKQNLIDHLTYQLNSCVSKMSTENGVRLEDRAKDYIRATFGQSDLSKATADVKKAMDEFVAAQTYELIDPLNIRKVIEDLQAEIDEFTTKVDSALSVSNALTMIEFEY